MAPVFYGIVAGLATFASIFVGFILTFGFSLIPFGIGACLGIAACGYVSNWVTEYLFAKENEEKQTQIQSENAKRLGYQTSTGMEALVGVDPLEFADVMHEVAFKNLKLLTAISSDLISITVREIHSTVADIIAQIKMNPKHFRDSRKWITMYLDQTVMVVDQYQKLSRKEQRELEIEMNHTLSLVKNNLIELANSLKSDNIENLKIDLELLQDQMKQYTR